jgi:preprotein translocase subunit SecA
MNDGAAHERILDIFNDAIFNQCELLLTSEKDANPQALVEWMAARFPVECTLEECSSWIGQPEAAGRALYDRVEAVYNAKCESENQDLLPSLERMICLSAIDEEWQKFLSSMDDLRRSVSLRGYGQRDPLVEYKREAFEMFSDLMVTIKSTIVRAAFRATTHFDAFMRGRARQEHRIAVINPAEALKANEPQPEAVTPPSAPKKPMANFTVTVPGLAKPEAEVEPEQEPPVTIAPSQSQKQGSLEALMQNLRPNATLTEAPTEASPVKVGRNDACPCGSGKKYKVCCGR